MSASVLTAFGLTALLLSLANPAAAHARRRQEGRGCGFRKALQLQPGLKPAIEALNQLGAS